LPQADHPGGFKWQKACAAQPSKPSCSIGVRQNVIPGKETIDRKSSSQIQRAEIWHLVAKKLPSPGAALFSPIFFRFPVKDPPNPEGDHSANDSLQQVWNNFCHSCFGIGYPKEGHFFTK
jgi:hypothetical protein